MRRVIIAIRTTHPIYASVLLVLIGVAAFGQQRLNVAPSVQVSSANAQRTHSEVIIAADPANAKNLVACSMTVPQGPSSELYRNITYSSFDGGLTWSPTLEFGGSLWSSDPSCAYGKNGSVVHAALVFDSVRNKWSGKTVLYRSADAGKEWSKVTTLAGGDREFVTVNPRDGTIYITERFGVESTDGEERRSALIVYRSDDGGRSFLTQAIFAPKEKTLAVPGHPGGVTADATFITSFSQLDGYDYPSKPAPGTEGVLTGKVKVLQSRPDVSRQPKPVVVDNLYSCDWEIASVTMPSLAIDNMSKAFRGRVYVVWPDSRSGRCEILLSRSSDDGKTWSKPIAVNDDETRSSTGKGRDHFHPVLAVNSSGVVGVMWYDRRESSDNLGWCPRFSASLDGGETFLPSISLTDARMTFYQGRTLSLLGVTRGGGDPIDFFRSEDLRANLGYHFRHGLTGGETAGLAADAAGVFHALWIDNRTGINQVWTAPVTVQGVATKNGSASLEKLEDVSKNVTVDFANVTFDRTRQTVEADAYILNTSKDTLHNPVKLRVLRVKSELGTATAANADSQADNSQGVWDFSSFLSSDGALRPGERTSAKRLVFRIVDLRPALQAGDYKKVLSFVSMDFDVLAAPVPRNETSNEK